MEQIQRLIYLCHKKNELNRKRRRFYYWMNFGRRNVMRLARGEKGLGKCHISATKASKGYYDAQQEMKSMTHTMRKMRVEMGVKFIWNDGGLIEAIELSNKVRLKQTHFKKFYEAELFEMEFFNG